MAEAHEIDLAKGHYANTEHFPGDVVQQIIVAFGKACGAQGYEAAPEGGLVMSQERWDALRADIRKVVSQNLDIAFHAGDPEVQRARLERDRARASVIAVAGKLAEALGIEAPPFEA